MKLIAKWSMPLRTISEANSSEHWRYKHARHRMQKHWIKNYWLKEQQKFDLPIHIKLTRYAPNRLDQWDNLPMSFKWILDCLAELIRPGLAAGRADDTDQITVEYHQVKDSKYKIEIEFYQIGSP